MNFSREKFFSDHARLGMIVPGQLLAFLAAVPLLGASSAHEQRLVAAAALTQQQIRLSIAHVKIRLVDDQMAVR